MGTSAVTLVGRAERYDGTRWTNLAEVIFKDTLPGRIEAAGSVGLTADVQTPFRYVVFRRTAL
jgi:hypothetical protein